MDIPVAVREALELQILEQEPEAAATVLGTIVSEHGPVAVAAALLDAGSVALRRMVDATGAVEDLADLLTRLALDGAVPEHRLDLLTEVLTAMAATAGGIRPPVDALLGRLGDQELLFGAWLGLLTTLRVASLAIEVTETELLEDVLLEVDVEHDGEPH